MQTRIALLRVEKRISQKKLAEKLNISREKVKFWELGGRHIKDDDIVMLCDFFDVSADYLLGLADTRKTVGDLAVTAKYTGLSEDALEAIAAIKDKGKLERLLLTLQSSEVIS